MSWKWAMDSFCRPLMWAWTFFFFTCNARWTCLLLFHPVHVLLSLCWSVNISPLLLPVSVVWFYVLSFSLVVFGLPLPRHCNPPCVWKWWYTCFYGYTQVLTLTVSNPTLRYNSHEVFSSWEFDQTMCNGVSVCPKLLSAQLKVCSQNIVPLIDQLSFLSSCGFSTNFSD